MFRYLGFARPNATSPLMAAAAPRSATSTPISVPLASRALPHTTATSRERR